MRKLLILCFFLPLIAWAQSSLPPCPETGLKHNCLGFYHFSVGQKYVGEFRNDKYNGRGTYTWPDGRHYSGEFRNDKFNGRGTYVLTDGRKYVGEFQDDNRHGQGIEYLANGSVNRSGRWQNDNLVESSALDTNQFPFNPPSRVAGVSVPQQPEVQSSLPPCPAAGVKHDCFGRHITPDSGRYVGEYRNDNPSGFGIQYRPDATVSLSGIWANGRLTSPAKLFVHHYPFWANQEQSEIEKRERIEAERADAQGRFISEIRRLPGVNWSRRLETLVLRELERWVAYTASSLEEIPAPSYPAALSLKQEPWETNKEFEDRVEKARTERRLAIDRLQAEYRAKVEERNKRVAEFNLTRTEREAQLPQKRRELVLLGISILNPSVAIADPALDQQSGALTVSAQVDGLGKQTFAFKDTPQAFRKLALTEPKAMKAKPEFQVSDTGEITLQAITVEAGGASVRGIPSAGITTQVQLATVNLPQAAAPAIVQQSAVTVDRNQVEQILYREENELLRKRLEEQRKQQEQAVANAEAKAAAEIARIREEAKKTQPDSRPVLNYAAVKDAHALVIGNSAYPGSNRLANPVNDAKAMSTKLRSLGFKVTELANANREQMVRGLSEFSKTASRADLTLLFYAGHGVQISGTNYMIPVDMSLTDASQATLQAVSLNSVVEQYLPGTTKLVFLDACRDNPLMATVGRGITKGLAPINVSQGTLIAYATKDGQTAEDGVGKVNSPFTAALLEHLSDPEDIGIILRTVRAKVMAQTQNRQQPWEYGSLTGGALVLSAIKR